MNTSGQLWRSVDNIYRLGLKELRSLWHDKVLLLLIVWSFTGAIYAAAKGVSQELNNAAIAVVDEDQSQLSARLIDALTPPWFQTPVLIGPQDIDAGLDNGRYAFVLVLPARMERDLRAGKVPDLQLNIDATVMNQAFIGASYLRNILEGEIREFLTGKRDEAPLPITLTPRVRFNPNLIGFWFGGVMEVINNVTMLSIILVGAAVVREREHGTLEHLLVMPLQSAEIMLAKIWANGLAVLLGASFALVIVVQQVLRVPIAGSVPLFIGSAVIYLFAAASIGIFLATLARSMPQLGLLIILVIMPLLLLSGGVTPRESMPEFIQQLMLLAPTTYFVRLAQAILYRGAGLAIVWSDLLLMSSVGSLFFGAALLRFRQSVTLTQV
jgi:ABC-2 type transport system permease protein